MTALRPAAVRVPASTSNLGAGFDCVGLAVERWLDAAWEPGPAPFAVARPEGTPAPPGRDLVAESFLRALEAAGEGPAPTGTLRVRSGIPVGFGLGSSAAALVAGAALAGLARGETLDRDGAFALAAREERHGDNAGPAAYGGLVAVVGVEGGLRAVPLELSPALGFAFAAPPGPLSTREARRGLPTVVPHAAAVDAVGRAVALLRGLATGDPDLLRLGFHDVALHAPWRMALIPGAARALDAALEAGAWGVTVSGAGSGLLAVAPGDGAEAVAAAMREALVEDHGEEGTVGWRLTPATEGVRAV